MNIFITATDTDSGKTIVSSWICLHTNARYWKPIQTGDDIDSQTVREIAPETEILPTVYKLKVPLSPYDSANLENLYIDINKLKDSGLKNTVIEGAGGALVPIAENFYMADLIGFTNSKAIIVAKSKLGFLNHIFLTIESLQARGVEILGIIINGETENFLLKTIEKFAKLSIIQVLPYMGNIKNQLKDIMLPMEIRQVLS